MAHPKETGVELNMSVSQPASTGRKGSKKVRTGCITCKIRKVKCDEVKPFCMRCTKTGRKCDGYVDRPARRSPGHAPQTSLLFIYEWASQDEKRSFHFFQHVTAPTLSGDFDAYFWRVLVLQICQSEPAVKHAVLAVSSLHEGMLQETPWDARYADGSSSQSFSLQQYNKAIACMLDLMKEADIKPLSPLLTCLLFVCIEFMQSKDVESLNHLEKGRQILSQLKKRASSTNAEIDMIKQHLVPMYMRLSFTTFMFGGSPAPIPTELKMIKDIPSAFESIDDAQYCLYDFMDECMRFTRRTRYYRHIPDVPITTRNSLKHQQEHLLKKLGRFNVAYSLYQTLNPNNASTSATALLQIHLHLTSIWLSTALTNKELDFDDHLSTFVAIIPLASSFLDTASRRAATGRRHSSAAGETPPRNKQESVFSFDMHVIAPLYYVATKCRHPLIRRAALDLLRRNSSRRENLWRANIMAEIATLHIKLEEQSTIQGLASPLSRPIQEPSTTQRLDPPILWGDHARRVDSYEQPSGADQSEFRLDLGPHSLAELPNTTITPVSMVGSYQPLRSLPGDGGTGSVNLETQLFDTVETSSPYSFASSSDQHYPPDTSPRLIPQTAAMLTTTATIWQPARPLSICLEPPTPMAGVGYGLPIPNSLSNPKSSPIPYRPATSIDSSSGGTNSDDEMANLQEHQYAPQQNPAVTYSSRFSNESPFDIPEHLRIQNTIIEESEEGSWVVMFRKLHGLDGEWDATPEFVVASGG